MFAGATVVIALLGMFALGVSVLNGAAVAAAIGVVLVLERVADAAAGAARLRRAPDRRGPWSAARPRRRPPTSRASGCGGSAQVQRRPAVTAVAATAVMLAFAAPALGLRLASSDAGNDPAGQTTRQAYDLLAKGFGPGFNGPLQVAVALPQRARHGGAHAAHRRGARDPGRRVGGRAAR